MPDFTVARRGTDSSGRPIYTTTFFWAVWLAVLARPRVRPFAHLVTVVQGGFMVRVPGGGADKSAGYHDAGGTIDVRTWNLTPEQQAILWWEAALLAIYFWPRDATHGGMDPHGHCAAGWDHPCSDGIDAQWRALQAGRDGLTSNGPDYVTRPRPLVLYPPTDLLEDYMATDDAQRKLDEILTKLDGLDTDLGALTDAERRRYQTDAKRQSQRYARLVKKIGALADHTTGPVRKQLLDVLTDEDDVTGPDNPAGQS